MMKICWKITVGVLLSSVITTFAHNASWRFSVCRNSHVNNIGVDNRCFCYKFDALEAPNSSTENAFGVKGDLQIWSQEAQNGQGQICNREQ